jgi:uncharacterized protein (UPF0371 family)
MFHIEEFNFKLVSYNKSIVIFIISKAQYNKVFLINPWLLPNDVGLVIKLLKFCKKS